MICVALSWVYAAVLNGNHNHKYNNSLQWRWSIGKDCSSSSDLKVIGERIDVASSKTKTKTLKLKLKHPHSRLCWCWITSSIHNKRIQASDLARRSSDAFRETYVAGQYWYWAQSHNSRFQRDEIVLGRRLGAGTGMFSFVLWHSELQPSFQTIQAIRSPGVDDFD